jgi:isoquinoline 1-oxidoreductase beta subunit
VEAAAIAQKVNGPVKLCWSREDDLRHDQFRAGGFHFLKGGVDAKGQIAAWHNHFVTFGTMSPPRGGGAGELAIRPGSGASFANDPGQFPAHFLNHDLTEETVMECNIRWARGAPRATMFPHGDPKLHRRAGARRRPRSLEFRLDLLSRKMGGKYDAPRMSAVVKHVANKAGWNPQKFPRGQGQGIAFHYSHQGYVAQVAEVTVSKDGQLKVDRVVAVCDVGQQIVNRSGAENQVEGAIIDGIGTPMFQELNLERGRITQTTLHEYPMIRINDAPTRIETISCARKTRPPDSASRRCRRLRPPCATRSSPRPASACASSRCPGRTCAGASA